jgi:hypothetical protein
MRSAWNRRAAAGSGPSPWGCDFRGGLPTSVYVAFAVRHLAVPKFVLTAGAVASSIVLHSTTDVPIARAFLRRDRSDAR